MQPQNLTAHEIVGLVGEAEKAQDVETMRSLLHPDLVFRRASGVISRVEDVLGDMPYVTYEVREFDILELDDKPKSVVANVTVHAKGSRRSADGTVSFEGAFRNIMAFERDNAGILRCLLWINTSIGGP